MSVSRPVVLVTGATATGKSALALELATQLGGEILSIDSVAVYAGLDVGSAKPSPDDRRAVPHHLLDIVDPHDAYHLAHFLADARAALARVERSGRIAVLTGGTSMYATAFVEGWSVPGGRPDPTLRARLRERMQVAGSPALHRELARLAPDVAASISPNDGVRVLRALERALAGVTTPRGIEPAWSLVDRVHAYVIDRPAEETRARIAARANEAFLRALVEETRSLLARGVPRYAGGLRSVGYREALWYLDGKISWTEFARLVVRNTARLAKKQRTWWRGVSWAVWVRPEEMIARARADVMAAG